MKSIFGKIKYSKHRYFEEITWPYSPAVLSQLFFQYYNFNERNFLSNKAHVPEKLLLKDERHLLAFLLGFIIDEATIDSSQIKIKLKNPD